MAGDMSWGSYSFYIVKGSYDGPYTGDVFVRARTLSSTEFPTTYSSVMQQTGRDRKEITVDIISTGATMFNDLSSEKHLGTADTFTGHDGFTMYSVIWSLPSRERIVDDFHTFRCMFVESSS